MKNISIGTGKSKLTLLIKKNPPKEDKDDKKK